MQHIRAKAAQNAPMAVVGAQQMQLPSLNQLLESCQHSSGRSAASLLLVCYSRLFSFRFGVECSQTDGEKDNEWGVLSFCPHVHVPPLKTWQDHCTFVYVYVIHEPFDAPQYYDYLWLHRTLMNFFLFQLILNNAALIVRLGSGKKKNHVVKVWKRIYHLRKCLWCTVKECWNSWISS